MNRLEWESPCKINLLLNILGKRTDGFHELETVMHPVSLTDVLQFERTTGNAVQLTCNNPALPVDSTNLVCRAATSFLKAAGLEAGLEIHLEKRIPLAAGLGGGSSNAAATLLALNEMFSHPLSDRVLDDLAAGLGSDVPFFLQPHPAIATGHGERIHPVQSLVALKGICALLIHPGFGVATAWAYRALAHFPSALAGEPGRAQALIHQLQHGSLEAASAGFYNSLESPVFSKYPLLSLYQEFLREHGALATLMSGSGSTTFALVRGEALANELTAEFKAKFGPHCWTAVSALNEN